MATSNTSVKAPKKATPASAKADVDARKRHDQRKAWFIAEAARQARNRAIMARCEAFYDSEQIDSDIAQEMRDRGQNPVVYNECKPVIDWLIGTERRSRVDFIVIAEDEGEAADDDARNKTKLLKYIDDTNKAVFERSYAAEDQFKAGLGWLEVGIRSDQGKPMVFVGHESWRNMLWDSQASKRDLSDARYQFRIKVVDLDIALALFPDKEVELRSCMQTGDRLQVFNEWLAGAGLITGLDSFNGLNGGIDGDDYMSQMPVDTFNPRERVLLLECWSRDPVRVKTEAGDSLGEIKMKVRCAIMTEKDTLLEADSPFNHDRFPFIPYWAYRKRRTGLPYSPILPLMGPQESLNHRMSKSLWEASRNQLLTEVGAIDDEVMDLEEVRGELNSPDGMAVFANGALSGNKVREREDQGQAAKQLALAERDINTIRQMSGVTSENRGLDTSATSGIAIRAKADQGGMLTAELFDNQLLARQLEGEMTLSLAEQFIKHPMTIRVAGEQGNSYERVKINQPQADGTYLNDISERRAHFVVGEQAWKQAYAEAAFDSLMQVLTQLGSTAPNVVINLLDVVFEMNPNLPRKRQILERIRQVNGQVDPDSKPTPEQQQAAQQKAQMAQAEFEAKMATLQATVKEAQAKGEKLSAESMNTLITTVYEAAQAAQVAIQVPGAMVVADQLLASVGFKDQAGGEGTGAMVPSAPPQQPQQPIPPLRQADGAAVGHERGIQTVAADGATARMGTPEIQPEGS